MKTAKRWKRGYGAELQCNLKVYFFPGTQRGGFFPGVWWSARETRDSREIRRDAVGSLTKAFVTLSQTQQIRPILTLSQIRPISSQERPLLRRTDKLPWSVTAPGLQAHLFVLLRSLIGSPGTDNS